MPTPKPFLSYEQQLDKLIHEKNLVISDRAYAERMLRQYSYFTLISGYKEPFRNRTIKKYKDGTQFEEIVALYQFDESLRELFLKYIFMFEMKMKSLLSYYFTEKHTEDQRHYLSPDNYNRDSAYAKDVSALIRVLEDICSSSKYAYINHQRNAYGNVPLWAAVKIMTFGNISYMYRCFPRDLRTKVSKNFDWVNEDSLEQYLRVLTKYRNVCAHNDRLFSYRTKDDIPNTPLHDKLAIPMKGKSYIYGKNDLFSVVITLRYLLSKEDFHLFKKSLVKIISCFLKNTTHVAQETLLHMMGFPNNWHSISRYRP